MADLLSGKEVKRGRGVMKVYNVNPFMMEMTTKTKKVFSKSRDKMMVSRGSGEVSAEVAGFWEAHEVDATQFVKLFISGVKALKDLTQAGARVFEVLYLKVQAEPGKDLVSMGFWMVDQNITPLSERTYARGMGELLAKEFIAATPNAGLYWLNPSFVWNGDRLAFVKEYRRKPTPPTVPDASGAYQTCMFSEEDLG